MEAKKNVDNSHSTNMSKSQIAELEKVQSLSRIIYNQFKEHKAAVIGAYTILFFLTVALTAPLIASFMGVDAETQNVFNRYKPPFTYASASVDKRETEVRLFIQNNPEKAAQVQTELIHEEFVSSADPEDAIYEWSRFDKRKALAAIKYLNIDSSTKSDLRKIANKFETFHLFGTDELGRDVLMRLVYGTRISMGVGILVAVFSALIGLIVGALAGYYGGLIDAILMRITDALLSLPLMPVLIVMAAIDLQKVPILNQLLSSGSESTLKLILILCVFSWMPVSRLVRGSILTLREREFILASKTLGATDFTIITRHMFPNVIAPLLVSVTLGVGESILFEAALSFLGLGIQPPTPSWGNMLFNAQELIYQAPFLAILPGLLILFVTISFNYVGDGLQDAIDPKTIKR
ncbi:ABC transporter permease [Pseudobdellovibrio exovorus]|uniref:ABC transporter, membrane spanning protein n=1 Tax=Pseudobdellovibrio exovorus JSS TaxID=1184267 RepID=M4VAX2_9BACT|nr:ABC transporter permease [Pseudobdellovibrio exovorus]AGH95620.1 ABC transporter, membrane spanning protein [Pseudobdellovibrio exovorus JSS]